jgi:glycosyltransferase involved in cell wall biosynthesis
MKILLLSRYGRLGASSRLRSYQYLPVLKECGFKIDVVPLLDDSYLTDLYAGKKKNKTNIAHRYFSRLLKMMNCHKYDLLWIEKELFPWFPSWVEEFLAASGVKYIVDYDDAVFHRYDMLENNLLKKILGQKIDRIMQGAALVIAGNDYLAKRAVMSGAKRVERIPTVIDLDRYPIDRYPNGNLHQNETFSIGWIGSPVTVQYLYHAKPALMELCKNNKACLVTMGAGPLHMKDVIVKDHPWSEETEAGCIRNFDVGIMPLPDEPWTLGKCGYKLIQYMACGKPVVASAVGANIEIIDHGKNGFLVESEKEWIKALTILSENKELRKKMGRHGRKKVETSYCLQVTASKLITIIKICI